MNKIEKVKIYLTALCFHAKNITNSILIPFVVSIYIRNTANRINALIIKHSVVCIADNEWLLSLNRM